MDERRIASEALTVLSFYRAIAYERVFTGAVLSLFGAAGATLWLGCRLRVARQQAEAGGVGVADHSPARVLVADDNAVNRRAAVRMLEHLGLQADVSANGREAVEMLRLRAYDLVLMDCRMPVMNGQDAATEIRKREPPGRHTPIVAMTAEVDGDCLNRCLESGMDDMLLKPIRMEELTALLFRWLATDHEKHLEAGGIARSALGVIR